MENQFRPQESPEERLQLLETNCFKKEVMKIRRPFTEEEIQTFKIEFADKSIVISEKEDLLQEAAAPFKAEIKELQTEAKGIHTRIKRKYEEEEGEVYLFDDQENRKMIYYDRNGIEIQSRPLLPHERTGQARVFSIDQSKTA